MTTAAIAVLLAAGCGSGGGERDADADRAAPSKAGDVSQRAPDATGPEAREPDQSESRGAYGY